MNPLNIVFAWGMGMYTCNYADLVGKKYTCNGNYAKIKRINWKTALNWKYLT